MHVTEVLGATSEADGVLRYEPIAADGTTAILSSSAIKIRFDRLLHPGSVTRQAICFQPLVKKVVGSGDCTAGAFLEPTYDPVRREVTFRHPPGGGLAGGLVYTLTVYVGVDPAGPGFRSFEGTPLDAIARFELRVRPDGGVAPPPDPLPAGEHWCASADPACAPACGPSCDAECAGSASCRDTCVAACEAACPRSVAEILGARGCGSGGCHGGAEPAAGLDLASNEGLLHTAVEVVAHGAQTGGGAHDPEANPARFGRAMPVIARGAPGLSYLLYKVLASPQTPLEAPISEAERERVQNTIIVGAPMPPDDAPAAQLRAGEAEWLADWVIQRAPVSDCP